MKLFENYWYVSVEKLLLRRKKARDWAIADGLTAMFIALTSGYVFSTTELYASAIILFIAAIAWVMSMSDEISKIRWIDFIIFMKEKEGKTYGYNDKI